VQKEAPVHASNVMVKDPKSGSATRVGYARTKDVVSGKKKVMRVAQKSGEMF
jgi:large subunit ribosomal protein L24